MGIGYKTEDAEYYSLKEYEAIEAEKNGTIETLIFKDVDYKGEDRSVSGFLLFERSQTSFISMGLFDDDIVMGTLLTCENEPAKCDQAKVRFDLKNYYYAFHDPILGY